LTAAWKEATLDLQYNSLTAVGEGVFGSILQTFKTINDRSILKVDFSKCYTFIIAVKSLSD